jgi:hypothetical protein
MIAARTRIFLALGALLASLACEDSSGMGGAMTLVADPVSPVEREQILGPFLAGHWRLPVARQGSPPSHFSEAERSLDPAICGSCHPTQYAEWSTSLHAAAWSPGLAGQLIEGALAHPGEVRSCQSCHTPLSEQIPFGAALQPNGDFDPELRARGLPCAGCHVRGHRYYGPPRRPEVPPVPEPVPHSGFEVRPEYLESRFCAECHQFFDDAGVNGKPIQNTFAEWQRSPQAAEGRQCQDCHMPDRAHLWRGIHDPEMVRQAVDVDLVPADVVGETLVASLVLLNRDVGHALPTYVTARIFLAIYQMDAAGREIPGTRVEGTVGREVDFDRGIETFDTRVLPGESVRLDYAEPRREGAAELVGRVAVDPDHHYRGLFAGTPSPRSAGRSTLRRERMRRAGERAARAAHQGYRFIPQGLHGFPFIAHGLQGFAFMPQGLQGLAPEALTGRYPGWMLST